MRRRRGEDGQSLVEFAFVLPVFLLLLFGMLEFGFAFTHQMALEYATREGARVGAALGPGGGSSGVPCDEVDDQVIAAVQRVLTSPGTQLDLGGISQVRVFKADTNGAQVGSNVNIWTRGPGPTIDGTQLLFSPPAISGWSACGRLNGSPPDSIGVGLTYDYAFVSPLGILMGLGGAGSLTIDDQTVMALNPSL